MVKQAHMVLALTCFQPESNLCFGGTGWAVEMAKFLKKVLYVYDVQRDTWFWYNPDQDLFYACDQMAEEQYALPTLVHRYCRRQECVRLPRDCLGIARDFKTKFKSTETRMQGC